MEYEFFTNNKGQELIRLTGCRIINKNFSGDKFGKGGYSTFCMLVPDEETKDALMDRGWEVRIRPPREPGQNPFMFLPIKIKFNDFGPLIYLKSGGRPLEKLSPNRVKSDLDRISIECVDMDISQYYDPDKGTRTAWLREMKVYQRATGRFAEEYERDHASIAPVSLEEDPK